MRVTLDTKGIEEAMNEIARLGEDVDQAAAQSLHSGGQVLLKEMKGRVPKDTGNLDRHLVATEPEVDGNYIATTVGISKHADKRTAVYATAQEYGTSSMAAQPYVRPGLDTGLHKARRAMIEYLCDLLKPKG
jgi:HK97 gp10 family phage protein